MRITLLTITLTLLGCSEHRPPVCCCYYDGACHYDDLSCVNPEDLPRCANADAGAE